MYAYIITQICHSRREALTVDNEDASLSGVQAINIQEVNVVQRNSHDGVVTIRFEIRSTHVRPCERGRVGSLEITHIKEEHLSFRQCI